MAKRKPVVWCRPLVGSQRYDVLIANADSCPHLEGRDEAVTVWESTTIAIREDLSDERKEDCLAHELFVHAVFEATGIGRMMRTKLGLSEKQWDEFEEDLAHTFAPALLATLKSNDWLQLPKLPARARASSHPPAAKKTRKAAKR